MSKIEKFEDIKAWQNSRELSKIIYNIFVDTQDWGFKNQICRASISIGNNIAEGFDRQSNKELRQFLYIAKGSCSEVRSMIYIGIDLGYINQTQFEEIHNLCTIISKQLTNFIKSIS